MEAARDAGVHLAFFSGNEVFWKTRWETSIDGPATPYRTLVCYKETHDEREDRSAAPEWTGTWRDPRFSPPSDGGRPGERADRHDLHGQLLRPIGMTVPCGGRAAALLAQHDAWPRCSPARSPPSPTGTLGYEWDEDLDNGFRPAGR